MRGSVTDAVFGKFGKRKGQDAARAAPRAEDFDGFWRLRVPDGVAPDNGCLTLKIEDGQPGNGIALAPGRYKLTNELVKFLALSDAAITHLGIEVEGTDVYARLVPGVYCRGTEVVMRRPNGEIIYK
tara:strand:+ start:390 stop:770 length:381 start_codon:yes stop_codon:yes gene_type:complete